MSFREYREKLWRRVDELHALVSMMAAEQARLRTLGEASEIDLLAEQEKLIEEADALLHELEHSYDDAGPKAG